MTFKTIGIAVLVLAAAGCASAQRPYSFELTGARSDTVGELVRGLAANGHAAVNVDHRSGVLHTEWEDTGFMYGKIGGLTATIVRRYTVTVQPSVSGALVVLRVDSKRCTSIGGRCEVMDGIVGSHQSDLDALGQELQSTLVGGGVVVTPQG